MDWRSVGVLLQERGSKLDSENITQMLFKVRPLLGPVHSVNDYPAATRSVACQRRAAGAPAAEPRASTLGCLVTRAPALRSASLRLPHARLRCLVVAQISKQDRPTSGDDAAAFHAVVASLYGWLATLVPSLKPKQTAMGLFSVARLELFNEELVLALANKAKEVRRVLARAWRVGDGSGVASVRWKGRTGMRAWRVA